MFAVASSRITIRLVRRIALQMQISCRSPELRFFPPSEITMLMPRSVSSAFSDLFNNSFKPALLSSSSIRLSSTLSNGSKLNLREPEKRVGSYGMTVTFSLNFYRSTLAISTPSISTWPSKSSTILLMLIQIVDLPAPVRPTIPILVLGRT